MYQIQFGWGSAPDSAGGAYSAPPDPLVGLRGPTSKGGRRDEGSGREGEGRGREGKGGEGKGRGLQPFTPPLIHISGYAPEYLYT